MAARRNTKTTLIGTTEVLPLIQIRRQGSISPYQRLAPLSTKSLRDWICEARKPAKRLNFDDGGV